MKTLDEIKQIISTHIDELKGKYKVKSVGIFGSFVKNEQNRNSDIDILIEFTESVGGFHYLETKYFLSSILNHEVDLVMKKALGQKRRLKMKEQVLKEAVMML